MAISLSRASSSDETPMIKSSPAACAGSKHSARPNLDLGPVRFELDVCDIKISRL